MSYSPADNRSIKTFFIYAGIVLLLIIISLSAKAVSIIKNNKFDGEHQLILAIAKDGKVKEVVLFNPNKHALTQVSLKDDINIDLIAQQIGVIPDAKVNTAEFLPSKDIPAVTKYILTNYYHIKTDLTIFDAVRLFFESQKSVNDQTAKDLILSDDIRKNDKFVASIFNDDNIFSENVSVQIINASSASGVGKRLERELNNLGVNVISVATARSSEPTSKIKYFGDETYTLHKLKKILAFPVEKSTKELIAKIVVIIGEDNKNFSNF
ncbi:LytR C-terminal domain-containing protein [Candidatus Roizmanbacteria bacterium]|nr:LytR C-terminal domain-containing protein [Candidatus Roizmanbacteria bacterium]